MEPIISPWLIYALSVVGNLKEGFIGISIAALAVSIILWIIYSITKSAGVGYGENDSDNKTAKAIYPFAIKTLIVLPIVGLFAILTPSKNTLIGMIVADQITYDSLGKAVNTGKAVKNELKKDVLDIIEAITKENKEKK